MLISVSEVCRSILTEKRSESPYLGVWKLGGQGASHGGSEKPGKLEVGGASRDSTGLGALEEGLISS